MTDYAAALTDIQLAQAMNMPILRAQAFLQPTRVACSRFQIDTRNRLTMFLANVAQETGALRLLREVWGPTPEQARYWKRADLGNTRVEDGFNYRGGGGLMATGLGMYSWLDNVLHLNLVASPDLITRPDHAMSTAAAIWSLEKQLNDVADAGSLAAFKECCSLINTGRRDRTPNGWDERQRYYALALRAIP